MTFLTVDELSQVGLKTFGRKVLIDSSVRFINPAKVEIGDNVRIDMGSLISAGNDGIVIGSHIHLGAGIQIFGGGGRVSLHDFSGMSPGVKLFTASDDFIIGWLRGPQISEEFRKVEIGPIVFGENAVAGANSVVLPNCSIGFNSSVGALTVISRDVDENLLVAGNPARTIGRRDGELAVRLMQKFREQWSVA